MDTVNMIANINAKTVEEVTAAVDNAVNGTEAQALRSEMHEMTEDVQNGNHGIMRQVSDAVNGINEQSVEQHIEEPATPVVEVSGPELPESNFSYDMN